MDEWLFIWHLIGFTVIINIVYSTPSTTNSLTSGQYMYFKGCQGFGHNWCISSSHPQGIINCQAWGIVTFNGQTTFIGLDLWSGVSKICNSEKGSVTGCYWLNVCRECTHSGCYQPPLTWDVWHWKCMLCSICNPYQLLKNIHIVSMHCLMCSLSHHNGVL